MTEESERPKPLRVLALLAIPILGVLITSYLLGSDQRAAPSSGQYSLTSFDLLTPVFVSLLVLSGLFYGLRRDGEQTARVIVAGITLAGTLSGLLLLRLWLDAYGTVPVTFYLLLAPIGYLGVYWSVRGYYGRISPGKSGLLMVASTTLLGALVGLSFPLTFTILLLFALSLLDILVVESDLVRKIVGQKTYDSIIIMTTLPIEKYAVGLGDFLAYSILVASSLRSIGLYGAGTTIALILAGALVTSRLARSRLRVPGLPIPLWLGLVPSLLGLIIP